MGKQLIPWMRCRSLEDSRRGMHEWAQTAPGHWLQAEEVACLGEVLPTLFGYHLLQVGDFYPQDCLTSSKISHRILMDEWLGVTEPGKADQGHSRSHPVQASPESLPIATDSLDVVILPHTLEFTEYPHQILREADRILIPEGHVVVLGFNPWSLWMLWRLVLGWRGRPPWCGRFISQTRLRDWLQLLGFDIIQSHHYFFRPPLRHQATMKRLRFMERLGQRWWPALGGGYLLVARKRVVTLTPVRPRWRPSRAVPAAGLVGNSRKVHCHADTRSMTMTDLDAGS